MQPKSPLSGNAPWSDTYANTYGELRGKITVFTHFKYSFNETAVISVLLVPHPELLKILY